MGGNGLNLRAVMYALSEHRSMTAPLTMVDAVAAKQYWKNQLSATASDIRIREFSQDSAFPLEKKKTFENPRTELGVPLAVRQVREREPAGADDAVAGVSPGYSINCVAVRDAVAEQVERDGAHGGVQHDVQQH